MRRTFLFVLVILLLSAAVGEVDNEANMAAQRAEIPAGLSDHEADIYRQGFAEGYHAAMHPADIEGKYILNTSSRKFHKPTCSSAASIKDKNREIVEHVTREQVIAMGYAPCGVCNP